MSTDILDDYLVVLKYCQLGKIVFSLLSKLYKTPSVIFVLVNIRYLYFTRLVRIDNVFHKWWQPQVEILFLYYKHKWHIKPSYICWNQFSVSCLFLTKIFNVYPITESFLFPHGGKYLFNWTFLDKKARSNQWIWI